MCIDGSTVCVNLTTCALVREIACLQHRPEHTSLHNGSVVRAVQHSDSLPKAAKPKLLHMVSYGEYYLPSNISSSSPPSTASQSMLPPLPYTLSYEAMLACEKKGTSSRMLSICRSDRSMGRRIGLLSTVGVEVGPCSGGGALCKRINEWPVLAWSKVGTHSRDRQVTRDLC